MRSLPFRRRDPWWDLEGSTARWTRRRQRVVALIAFGASVTACGGAAALWAICSGLAPMLGFHVSLPIR